MQSTSTTFFLLEKIVLSGNEYTISIPLVKCVQKENRKYRTEKATSSQKDTHHSSHPRHNEFDGQIRMHERSKGLFEGNRKKLLV